MAQAGAYIALTDEDPPGKIPAEGADAAVSKEPEAAQAAGPRPPTVRPRAPDVAEAPWSVEEWAVALRFVKLTIREPLYQCWC